MISRALPPYKTSFIRCQTQPILLESETGQPCLSPWWFSRCCLQAELFVLIGLEEKEEEDEENFAMVSKQI